MHVALVNCLDLPEPDLDEAPLLGALRAAGHDAQAAAWDDPRVDWSTFDVAVIRATWNYHTQPGLFLAWCDEASCQTRLLNGPDVVRWNAHKRYLSHFEARRIPIVPTIWADHAANPADDPIGAALARGWPKLVVKPSVSAGSRDTRVFGLEHESSCDDAREFVSAIRAREDVMVQRYMASVERGGESAIVTISGVCSHSIRKSPRFAGQDESVSANGAVDPVEQRFAVAVLEACPFETLYARVDVMRDDAGGIVLSELELIEPSLFFPHAPGSAERMAAAIGTALTEPIG
ncbi:MAG: hypothetical protein AAGA55_01810 [Planctomycetota bacterium]